MVVQETKRQEEILQTFFKEMDAGNMTGGGWVIVAIMGCLAGGLFCIPYQEAIAREISILPSLFAFQLVIFYMDGYLRFTEKKKLCYIYDKIKYLPISRAVLIKWRMKKLFRFCGKLALVFLGLQLFFAWMSFGTISLENILYPVIVGFVIPVSVCGYMCCTK